MSFLDGAFDIRRRAFAGSAAAEEGVPPTGPPGGSGDDISATMTAGGVAIGLVAVGMVIAWLMTESKPAFKPADGFVLLTGFYVAAQAIERLLELLPAGLGSKQAKANRAVIFPGLGFILAVLAAEWM